MSSVDVRDAVFVWPRWARSLLIVRAPISLARAVETPRSRSLSTMCSYLRSCFGVHSALGIGCSFRLTMERADRHHDPGGLVEGRAAADEILDPVHEVGVIALVPRRGDDPRRGPRVIADAVQPLELPDAHTGRFLIDGRRRRLHAGLTRGSESHTTGEVPRARSGKTPRRGRDVGGSAEPVIVNDETADERHNRQLTELLNELRVALPGVQ